MDILTKFSSAHRQLTTDGATKLELGEPFEYMAEPLAPFIQKIAQQLGMQVFNDHALPSATSAFRWLDSPGFVINPVDAKVIQQSPKVTDGEESVWAPMVCRLGTVTSSIDASLGCAPPSPPPPSLFPPLSPTPSPLAHSLPCPLPTPTSHIGAGIDIGVAWLATIRVQTVFPHRRLSVSSTSWSVALRATSGCRNWAAFLSTRPCWQASRTCSTTRCSTS